MTILTGKKEKSSLSEISPTTKSRGFVAAQDIAALVPMPELLDTLGIPINTRTRRAPCLLHNGSNPSAFSWTDAGMWFCFHCGKGGDKLTLVEEVRKCSFLDALRFLAALAGIEWADLNSVEVRRQLAQAKRKAQRVKAAAQKLHALEQDLLLAAREELLSLHRLRRNAGRRLTAIRRGEKPRFADEEEVSWSALALVAGRQLRTATRYIFLAFGSPTDRTRFALNPRAREGMVDAVLSAGVVVDGKGRVMELSA